MARPGNDERIAAQLVAVAVFGGFLLSPPVLSQFDRPDLVLGVPMLWGYLFLAWVTIIGLIAAVLGRSG